MGHGQVDEGHRRAKGTYGRTNEGSRQAKHRGGWVDDGFAFPKWEAFVGFVAPVAEEVATIVNAKVEALRQ